MNGSILLGIWPGTQCLPEVSGGAKGRPTTASTLGKKNPGDWGEGWGDIGG